MTEGLGAGIVMKAKKHPLRESEEVLYGHPVSSFGKEYQTQKSGGRCVSLARSSFGPIRDASRTSRVAGLDPLIAPTLRVNQIS